MKTRADEFKIDETNAALQQVKGLTFGVESILVHGQGNKNSLSPKSLQVEDTNRLVESIVDPSEEVNLTEDDYLLRMFSNMEKDSGKMHSLLQKSQGFAKDAQKFGAKKLTKAFLDLEKAWSNYHTELSRIYKQVKKG
jgi:hypothetical protein